MLKDSTFNCNTLTLKEFVSNCIVKGNSLLKRPRAKERVVSIYSQYSADVDEEQYKDFCRVQLMLNHVFTEINDLKEGCNSFSERYQHCIEQSCSHYLLILRKKTVKLLQIKILILMRKNLKMSIIIINLHRWN